MGAKYKNNCNKKLNKFLKISCILLKFHYNTITFIVFYNSVNYIL